MKMISSEKLTLINKEIQKKIFFCSYHQICFLENDIEGTYFGC